MAKRALVVDDVHTNLRVMEAILKTYGLEVYLSKSGESAIKTAAENTYDIIFMDYLMPGINGDEAALQIRALGVKSPIIALSATDVPAGFDGVLIKPIVSSELAKVLKQWIDPNIAPEMPADEEPKIAIKLPGIDIQRGISISGGNAKTYLHTLTVFHSEGKKRMKDMRNAVKDNELGLFTIYAHASRSAAANIGALALSEVAYSLEAAGQREDVPYINAMMEVFCYDFNQLLDNIYTVIAENIMKKADANAKEMRKELKILREAMDDFDTVEINQSAKRLQIYTTDTAHGTRINEILKQKLIGAYEEAIDLIDAFPA